MLVHLNNQILPLDQARISPLDRGFLFGDGIYEGLRAFGGRIVALDLHIKRMQAGLNEARIPWDAAALAPLSAALLKANKLEDAFIYWQVTRGAPAAGQPIRTRRLEGPVSPTIFGYCTPTPDIAAYLPPNPPPSKSMATIEDTRWLRGQVKSISLLGGVLASYEALEAGADDAILVRDGRVVETTSANVLLVLPRGNGTTQLVTPSLESAPLLAGVTRDLLIASGPGAGLPITQREVRAEELSQATEVMALGTLTMVTSIVRLNRRPVGDGKPGPLARRLLSSLIEAIRRS